MPIRRVVADHGQSRRETAAGPATTYASVGWRLPLDGFTRSAQRASRNRFHADSPRAWRRTSPIAAAESGGRADRRLKEPVVGDARRAGKRVGQRDRRHTERSKGIRLRRPVQITERRRESMEVMLGAVVVLLRGHELIAALASAMRRVSSSMAS